MNLTGVELWFFLPAVIVLHWLLPRRTTWQNAFLLAVSYAFYASWNPRMVLLLWVATGVDYLVGLYLGGGGSPRRRRAALAVSVVYNVGQLAYFKYVGFFADSFNELLTGVGLEASLPVVQVALPLGISFFTLQKLAYVVDVYYGRIEPCRSLLRFATFVAFFPHITAGPIVRANETLVQFAAPRRFDPALLRSGAAIFLLGFIKKAFVADFIGINLVDPVFAEPGAFSTAGHWLALLAYAVQVFCDFSGYSEMAIGLGRAFGIELPVNFNFPFLSRNLLEMWRRWHITLNTWLFEYLYGPLTTGTSWLRGRLDLGFLIVFGLSGLWHGAAWTFILWGLLHGLGLVVTRRWDQYYRGLCRKDRKYVALRKSRRYGLAAWALTQLFFVLTLLPFRAPSLEVAGELARGLVTPHGGLLFTTEHLPHLGKLSLLLCFAFVVWYHLAEVTRLRALRERFAALPPVVRGIAYGVVIAVLMVVVPVASGTFIYARF